MYSYIYLLSFFSVNTFYFFFFFNDTATTEIYTLSLHDALPISRRRWRFCFVPRSPLWRWRKRRRRTTRSGAGRTEMVDRKSTRLNSSHLVISYAVFCLKKKKKKTHTTHTSVSQLTDHIDQQRTH